MTGAVDPERKRRWKADRLSRALFLTLAIRDLIIWGQELPLPEMRRQSDHWDAKGVNHPYGDTIWVGKMTSWQIIHRLGKDMHHFIMYGKVRKVS